MSEDGKMKIAPIVNMKLFARETRNSVREVVFNFSIHFNPKNRYSNKFHGFY